MPTPEDDEIVELLVRLGNGRAQAMRRLAACRKGKAEDQEATKKDLLRRLRAQVRSQNAQSERKRREREEAQDVADGRQWLAEERRQLRVEQRAWNKNRPPIERLRLAVTQMKVVEMGPTSAQRFDNAGGGHGDPTEGLRQAPPGALQGFELEADRWMGRIERMARAAEHHLALLDGDATVLAAKSSVERDRRILSYVGEPISYIAYIEDVSTRHVEVLIREHRREFPEDGYRVKGGCLVREIVEVAA